jgi:hypothetical protein
LTVLLSDWASSGQVKIERANEHIRNLETEITAYSESRPYVATLQPKEDYDPGVTYMGNDFLVSEREPVPIRFAAIAADAIHNLHVALDHLWQRATSRAGHRHNNFPARENPEAAKALLKGIEQGRRHPPKELLRDLDAFQIGNPFWRIREFDDTDKHNTLTLVACYMSNLRISRGPGTNVIPALQWLYVRPDQRPPTVFPPPLEDGAILYAYPYIHDLNVDVQIVPGIAFGEGGIMPREAVLPTLQHFSTAVDSLARAFIGARLLK